MELANPILIQKVSNSIDLTKQLNVFLIAVTDEQSCKLAQYAETVEYYN
jgi:D-arabinose 5-phosphate isomerase GutQ